MDRSWTFYPNAW